MVWVGRELRDHPVPTLLPWTGQAALSSVQPGLVLINYLWTLSR